jgi:hypothetical protein
MGLVHHGRRTPQSSSGEELAGVLVERFVRQVVPILQTEGVFPAEYDAPTIRGRFGLPDPRAPERP